MTFGEPLRLDFLPWEYARTASEEDRERQAERQARLGGSLSLASDVYVAESAAVYCDELTMGERSYIAAHAYVTGHISLGADSTINPFCVVRGRVTIGDGVRIGAHTSLLAFNHGTAPGRPIFQQPHTALGITIGDDVWIGSNVTILDGITIGPHSIIGAGAVVTKNVPANTIAAGNPARVRRSRDPSTQSTPSSSGDLGEKLAAFAARARGQADEVLQRCWDGERFVDRPGLDHKPATRPWCDAVEIADLLLRRTPDGHTRDDLVRRLRARQDPETGLVSPGDLADAGLDAPATDKLSVLEGPASYHILCAGYALQLLDSCFEHPIKTDFAPGELERQLDNLPWARNAWSAGAGIDALGTALARNLKDHSESGPLTTLMGWLTLRADPATGAWGQPHPDDGWLQVVNGFYRLTRGTYAQFGLPLPYPEAAVKTVLAHSNDRKTFSGDGYNACNVLDVIHPLWLAAKQTDYGRQDATRWAEDQLTRILDRWVDGAGFAFAPDGTDDRSVPGLQGTEMWLAIIWLLADYLGLSNTLAYRPRGVHRPEPLLRI
ncbi:transferase family hexapeptide repeat protein [Kribbella antiqua]|uniref:Transferase family hexapeptide repeat protein n=1 Tax=Kribbella antiqua TaxID=2512217 RepID=A0A4R2IT00_9ACTN|nr:acyltransferase [Kribbella antiqua]TCO48611.1 transferase family hexapeptide repeat protein [Kribbella antiqua]